MGVDRIDQVLGEERGEESRQLFLLLFFRYQESGTSCRKAWILMVLELYFGESGILLVDYIDLIYIVMCVPASDSFITKVDFNSAEKLSVNPISFRFGLKS